MHIKERITILSSYPLFIIKKRIQMRLLC